MKRRFAAVAGALILAASCTPDSDSPRATPSSSPTSGPETGGQVKFGVVGEPPTLDPFHPRATDLTWALVRPLYPSLYRFTPQGRPVPYLAKSITETATGARVQLEEMNWSNGRPITASDVVASIERGREPSGFAQIASASATDDRTVALRGPHTDWPATLAGIGFVLPGGEAQAPGGIFGGPLVLQRHQPGLELRYAPNPEWVSPGPYLETVRVQFIASLNFAAELVEAERLDGALLPSSLNLDDRLDANGVDFASALGWESVYLDFGGSSLTRNERASLIYGIDREALLEGLVRDGGRLADTLYPRPGSEEIAEGPFQRGPGAASEVEGEVLLTVPAGDELLGFIQRVMQKQLEGDIDLELASGEVASIYGGGEGNPGGILLRRSAGIPGRFDPPDAVESLDAWPLFHVETYVARNASLQGVVVNPTVEGPLWNVEEWWWPDPANH
jgi:peptide/nickel transport system substrate-binding protein